MTMITFHLGQNRQQLEATKNDLLAQIAQLNAREPKDMNSEEYEAWADEHEELEDLLDEIQDQLDDLGE